MYKYICKIIFTYMYFYLSISGYMCIYFFDSYMVMFHLGVFTFAHTHALIRGLHLHERKY